VPEVFQAEATADEMKTTAKLGVAEEFDTSEGHGTISLYIQVYRDERPIDRSSLEFVIDPFKELQLAMNPSVQAGVYGICIAGQVGAKVWKDFQDCIADARKNNPTATKKKLWSEAIKCLAQKSGGAAAALATALTICDPLKP